MNVKVISLFEKENDPNGFYVNTTSKSTSDWQRNLSPFYLGPCPLYWDLSSLNLENAWQYSKVYPEYDDNGSPKESYFDWASEGWNNRRAVRYPMGKGKKPLYSWWNGKKFNYIDARKHIYIPLYAESVRKTEAWSYLTARYKLDAYNTTIYLKDFDAYRHEDMGMTLTDVVNNPDKKCGHAFVLMMMLTNDPILAECQPPT